jgi:5-methylcytosine-specific restriction protein A
MPHKRPRQCAVAGCPALIPIGEVYCDKHRKENFKRYEQSRDKSIKRLYSTQAWVEYRRVKLAKNPLCERHLRQTGLPVPATMVHHKDHVTEGGKFLPEFDETESLCEQCHAVLHPKGAIKDRINAK